MKVSTCSRSIAVGRTMSIMLFGCLVVSHFHLTDAIIQVRLVGGSRYNEGRVEVRQGSSGSWSTVCDDGWDIHAANGVCKRLGFASASRAVIEAGFGQGSGSILYQMACASSSLTLDDCIYNGWGTTNCNHAEDAGVICHSADDLEVRLVGGTYSSGLVEVRRGSSGEWGSICSTGWGMNEADVICRMMGFPSVEIAVEAEDKGFAASNRDMPVWLENVSCKGDEDNIGDCHTNSWGYHSCSRDMEAGVLCTRMEIRLVGKSKTPRSGRVEVRRGGTGERWGTVCDDNWDLNAAHVACKMLGYDAAESAVVEGGFGLGTEEIYLDEVVCDGNESSIDSGCSYRWKTHDCGHSEDAGVICAGQSCGTSPDVQNSAKVVHGQGIGDSLVYTCQQGYEMFGNATIHCMSDENWSEPPSCEAITCPPPPMIENAIGLADHPSWLVGDIIAYHCNPGFEMSGSLSSSECLESRLWSPPPKCQKISCGPPQPIQNGYIKESSGVSYNDSAVYECNAGYTMMTDSRSYCTEEGDWTHIPECHALSCGVPPIVEHARISELQGLSLGSLVRYQCIRGYVLEEHDYVLCLPDGHWGSNPICKAVSCGPPPSILNAYISQANATNTGDTYIHKCITGYELIGEPTVCQPSQEWSKSPKCQIISCGPPPVVPNSDQINHHTSYGSWAEYHCYDGYECLDCRSTVYCLASGTWEEPPVCERINCGSPQALANGTYTVNGTQFGDQVFYECVEGFTMDGNHSLECQSNGNWTSSPKCQGITCGDPPKVEFSAVTVTGYGYDDRASYTCDKGYELSGNGTSYCLRTGNWSIPPSCTIVSCDSPPPVPNSSVNTTDGTYGDLAVYKCETGFELIGNHTIKCLSSGYWSTSPKCNEITCGDPPSQQFATVVWTGDHYLEIATYHCGSGYGLSGSATILCQLSGDWTEPPVCEALTCGKPPTVSNTYSITMYPQWIVGEGITYRCLPGYEMSGKSISHCMENQQWSQPPSCISNSHSTIIHEKADVTTQSIEVTHTTATDTASTSTTKSHSTTRTSKYNIAPSTTPEDSPIQEEVTRENNTALIARKQPVNITFKYISSGSTAEGVAESGTNLSDYGDNSSFTNFSSSTQTHNRSEYDVRVTGDNSSVTSDSKGKDYNKSRVLIGCSVLACIAVVIAGAAVAYWIYTKKRRSITEESNFVPVDNQMYDGTELTSITVYSFKQPREDGSEDI